MQNRRNSAVAVVEAPAIVPRSDRARMQPTEFAEVVSRIKRTITVSASVRHANAQGVMAAAAAAAFNAGMPEARRLLLLAQGQLAVFGVVREEVAGNLRRLADQRDAEHAAIVSEHYPLLS